MGPVGSGAKPSRSRLLERLAGFVNSPGVGLGSTTGPVGRGAKPPSSGDSEISAGLVRSPGRIAGRVSGREAGFVSSDFEGSSSGVSGPGRVGAVREWSWKGLSV